MIHLGTDNYSDIFRLFIGFISKAPRIHFQENGKRVPARVQLLHVPGHVGHIFHSLKNVDDWFLICNTWSTCRSSSMDMWWSMGMWWYYLHLFARFHYLTTINHKLASSRDVRKAPGRSSTLHMERGQGNLGNNRKPVNCGNPTNIYQVYQLGNMFLLWTTITVTHLSLVPELPIYQKKRVHLLSLVENHQTQPQSWWGA